MMRKYDECGDGDCEIMIKLMIIKLALAIWHWQLALVIEATLPPTGPG